MMGAMTWLAAGLLITVQTDSGANAVATTAPAAAPVIVPGSRQIDFTSTVTGRRYRLMIARPEAPPPKEGYPVVYVIDGNLYFGTASDTMRLQSLHMIKPAVIVGIGYQTDNIQEQLSLRNKDLTIALPPALLATPFYKLSGTKAEGLGDIDAFLDMIEKEVKPRIEATVAIDRSDQTLFGYSLGGLTALRALFRHPQNYRSFVAGSPSIWWGEKAVLVDEAAFAVAVRSHAIAPRVLITVGGSESDRMVVQPSMRMTQAQHDDMTARSAMVPNARELAAQLAALPGASGYRADFALFAGEDHVGAPPATLARAFRFALAR